MRLTEFLLNMARQLDISGRDIDILKFAKAIISNQFNEKEDCIIRLYKNLEDLEKSEKERKEKDIEELRRKLLSSSIKGVKRGLE